jgi:hypothetical protein
VVIQGRYVHDDVSRNVVEVVAGCEESLLSEEHRHLVVLLLLHFRLRA